MSNPFSEREQEQALEREQLNAGWESGNARITDYNNVDADSYDGWGNNWIDDPDEYPEEE
jgi:hypothetical protein